MQFTDIQFETLMQNFIAYLRDGYISGKTNKELGTFSATCYGNYIRCIRNDFLNSPQEMDEIIELIHNDEKTGLSEFEDLSSIIRLYASKKNNVITDSKLKKAMGSWNSGLRALQNFLENHSTFSLNDLTSCGLFPDVTTTKVNSAILKSKKKKTDVFQNRLYSLKNISPAPSPKVVSSLDNKALKEKFISRLRTQDRFYPNIEELYFPVRIISKIFSRKDKSFRNWMVNDIKNLHLLNADGSFEIFENISSMEIRDDGSIYYVTKKGTFPLYTRTATNTIEQQFVKTWRSITLDHVISLENILHDNNKNLTGLREISDLWLNYRKSHNLELRYKNTKAETKIVNDFVSEYSSKLQGLKSGIVSDLTSLNLTYELMDGSENSKKGKDLLEA